MLIGTNLTWLPAAGLLLRNLVRVTILRYNIGFRVKGYYIGETLLFAIYTYICTLHYGNLI